MPKTIEGDLNAKGAKFAIIASRFNALVVNALVDGAVDCLVRHGAKEDDITIIRVPGGWELPLAAKKVLQRGGVDAVVVLGCVMRGETPHNEYITAEAVKGIGQLSMEHGIPVTFGVLTPNTMEQALERAGLKMGNKGAEAAEAAIEMVSLGKKLK